MSGLIKCFNTSCRDFSRSRVNNCSRPLTLIRECPEGIVRVEGGGGQGKRAMSQEQRDRIWYIKEFKGNECACGKTKRERTAFCLSCFKLLPQTYKTALYQDIGAGYEEAYEDAIQWLREQEVIE